jgi:hypothetical protein
MQDKELTALIARMERDQDRGYQPARTSSNASQREIDEQYTGALAHWMSRCLSDARVDRRDVTNTDIGTITGELLRMDPVRTGDRQLDPVAAHILPNNVLRAAIERAVSGRY